MKNLFLLSLSACSAFAGGRVDPLTQATRHAMSHDVDTQDRGIDVLRAAGPEGLRRLESAGDDSEVWKNAMTQVAAQLGAHHSGLYWYTDRDEAVEVGKKLGKPVLSLRMLGELTELYSCANSRFFRNILYANPDVAEVLERDFVLHWSSERPVPRITIDMGDGRVLDRTVTGNSVHYVLDDHGLVIDAIPGLHSPDAFMEALADALDLYDQVAQTDDDRDLVIAHHQAATEAALKRVPLGLTPEQTASQVLRGTFKDAPATRPGTFVRARQAVPYAIMKAVVEEPMLRQMGELPSFGLSDGLHPFHLRVNETVELHGATLEQIREELPDVPPGVLDSIERRFRQDLARDTIWNRDVLHTRLRHQLFRQGAIPFDSANQKTYWTFGTPRQDPWLGLVDPTVYTALPGAGIHLPD